jgi:hypothetical protein
MKKAIEDFLCPLRLRIHPAKSRVYRTDEGVTFLGWRLFRTHMRLDNGNVRRFRRRLRALRDRYVSGRAGWPEIRVRVAAWIAHAAHGDTWRLRRRIFADYRMKARGMAGSGVARGRLEQSTRQLPRFQPQQEPT